MENATKALIIAGAILIAILLIGLGITTYNNSKGVTDQANTTSDTLDKAANNEVEKINVMLQQPEEGQSK